MAVHGTLTRVGTVNLQAGVYRIAIGYYQGIGGADLVVRYAQGTVSQANFGTMTILDPSQPEQQSLWNDAPNNLLSNAWLQGNSVPGLPAPDGSQVAFIQESSSGKQFFEQAVTGLRVGEQYQVRFLENERREVGNSICKTSCHVWRPRGRCRT